MGIDVDQTGQRGEK